MKKLRGKHHFNNYKELCAALDIAPAPRGPKREEQKARIGKTYQITIHANNTIDLQRIPQKVAERQRKLGQGQIRMIDGREVDLGSNLLYRDTHIDQMILFRALTAEGKIDTKEGFIISCFERTKFFRELLARDSLESAKYSAESLRLVHELVVRRLYAMVNARLKRFEEKGYIQINRFYMLKHGGEASIKEVEPYVKQALRKMGLRREFQAYTNKERRKEFLELRNGYYEKDYGDIILGKKFIIEPLFGLDGGLKPGEVYEVDDDMVVGLSMGIFKSS